MSRQNVAKVRFTRQMLALSLALITLTISFAPSLIGGSAQAGRWLFGGKPARAYASAASPVREAIARKLQTQPRVKVELFVMSQCPFGVRAEEAMAPVLDEFGARVDFQLRFIATPAGDGFNSLHGQPEIDEDIRQVVMARQFPAQYFDYVVARAANYRSSAWQPVAAAAGIDAQAVERLARSATGQRLFSENIRRANELRIGASPTVFLDGEKYAGRILPPAPAAASQPVSAANPAPARTTPPLRPSINLEAGQGFAGPGWFASLWARAGNAVRSGLTGLGLTVVARQPAGGATLMASSVCGNGTVEAGEQCDDGNLMSGDGCDSNCTPTRCGNGIVTSGEECDDGNAVNTDSCTNACRLPTCGDGIVNNSFEQCDDGNAANTDRCTNICQNATCGDGIVRAGFEECDDANGINTDSCTNVCQAARCGDGFVNSSSEQCDDGSLTNGDGCSSTCQTECPTPVVTISGPASGALYQKGVPVNFTGAFTDLAGTTHTASWKFGSATLPTLTAAGTVVEPAGATPGQARVTQTFTTPGVYLVTLTVENQCGGTASTSVIGTEQFSALVVIYDPGAGFVIGGGWINSPAGAYKAVGNSTIELTGAVAGSIRPQALTKPTPP